MTQAAGRATSLAELPDEILLKIISYLHAIAITRLQLVARHYRDVSRDGTFWRERCFEDSPFLETLRRRQLIFGNETISRDAPGAMSDHTTHAIEPITSFLSAPLRNANSERTRFMANWDPTYPAEHEGANRVSWYDEYIQRQGPVSIGWFQQPEVQEGSIRDHIEVRGVALYRPRSSQGSSAGLEDVLAVSPLDDGSVCLWDVNGTKGRRGAVLAKSRPGILFIEGPGPDGRPRSKRIDSGVTECVSVDSVRHRAFFAVQSKLIEVDLQRLSVVDCTPFPWSITTLSVADPLVPLTVGTNLGVHLHDHRAHASCRDDSPDMIDAFDMNAKAFYERGVKNLFDNKPLPPMAPLSQPGPLSVLHLPRPGSETDLSDDIFVAGRFSNILHYDRRNFQSIRGSIFSGARLCSMACLPYPFSDMDSEQRRKGELTQDQVAKSKSTAGGRTVVACGEYGTKGSLELYGLLPTPIPNRAGGLQRSTLKNRQSTAHSKLLSVVNHGTRLAFSDGSGFINWFERDGFTEVRRIRIGHSEPGEETSSIFASMPGSDDIARKLLPTRDGCHSGRVNDNDLLFWTGEKLGLLSFSAKPGFGSGSFRDRNTSAEEEEAASRERAYNDRMRRALERQADDARLVRNLW